MRRFTLLTRHVVPVLFAVAACVAIAPAAGHAQAVEAGFSVGGGASVPEGAGAKPDSDTSRVADTSAARIQARLKEARAHHYFVVLDGAVSTQKALKKLDPATVTSIEILPGDVAEQRYGSAAKKGAVVITTSVKAEEKKSN